ncbi:MAG: hypothetical protein ICV78_01305 [Tolypothrix sp. Co-bin9]|nr:hypothetical protein [Tolypothrix sp. Co-bin9]
MEPTRSISSLAKLIVALAEYAEELLSGGVGGSIISTGTLKASGVNISVSRDEYLTSSSFEFE